MSSKLKHMVEVLVGVALAAALVAVLPGVAQAQDVASTKDVPSAPAQNPTSIVIVKPGDSLWSISHRLLGPNATSRQITEGVDRLYALNRDRIGADPHLITVGQKLLVPPAVTERSAGEATGETTSDDTLAKSARKTTDAAELGARGPAAKSTTDKAPRAAFGGAAGKDAEAPEPVAEPVTLPEAAAARIPAIRSLASIDQPPSPVKSFLRSVRSAVASMTSVVSGSFTGLFAQTLSDGRRLVGLGIILLTLVVAALMLWKLPMKRTTRWDAEALRVPTGYYGSVAYRKAPFAYHPGSLGNSLGERANPVASGVHEATTTTNGRVRILNAKAVARNGLALGVHNPEVRRAALRARRPMRARTPRSRRRTPLSGREPIE